MIKEFINRVKLFFAANPKRAKFIALIAVAAIIPLTVVGALTVQNLTQKASESPGVQIVDDKGNSISITSEINVLLKINLPSGWIAPPPSPSAMNNNVNIVKNAYAAASCTVTLKWDPMQFAGRKRQILFGDGPTVLSSNLNPIVTYDILPLDGNAIGSAGTYTFRNNVVAGTYTFDVNDYPEGSVHSVEVTAVADCPSNTQIQTPKLGLGKSCSFPTNCQDGLTCGNYDSTSGIGECIAASTPTPTLKRGLGKSCGLSSQCESLKCEVYDEFGNGVCVISVPTLSPTPKVGLGESCSISKTCKDGLTCKNYDESGNGICFASTSTTIRTITSTPVPTLAPQTPKSTPTPSPQIVKYILIENLADGSGGGSDPLRIASNIENAIKGLIPWRLNELSFSQTQAERTVQVTFFGDRGDSIPYTTTVILVPRGTSTNVTVTPAPKVPSAASTTTPEIQLTLTCQNTSKVKWDIKTNGVTTAMNLDLFIGAADNPKFSLKGQGANFAVGNLPAEPGENGTYFVVLRNPSTNKLIASATKEIDCSTFNPIISTPTPTPASISSDPVMKFDLSCQDKSTVRYTLSTTGAKPGMVLDLWINGNKVPQPGWRVNSSVSGKGANGNYASTLTDPVTYKVFATGGAPTKDCELFSFAYDLNRDGKVDADDVKIIESQYGTEGVNLDADINKDKKINGIDLNIILGYIKDSS